MCAIIWPGITKCRAFRWCLKIYTHYGTPCTKLIILMMINLPFFQGPQPTPFKLSIGESIDTIKEEFSFLQAQYNRSVCPTD